MYVILIPPTTSAAILATTWTFLLFIRYTIKLSKDIERVQKRCLRISFPQLSYSEALDKSGLNRLDSRREEITKQIFRQIKSPTRPLHCLIPPLKVSSSQMILRGAFNICSFLGGTHGDRVMEREPITRVLGQSPQQGPGAEPLVIGSGGEAPLKLKAFQLSDVQQTEQICILCSIFSNPLQ